jgi:hypothetical protein
MHHYLLHSSCQQNVFVCGRDFFMGVLPVTTVSSMSAQVARQRAIAQYKMWSRSVPDINQGSRNSGHLPTEHFINTNPPQDPRGV